MNVQRLPPQLEAPPFENLQFVLVEIHMAWVMSAAQLNLMKIIALSSCDDQRLIFNENISGKSSKLHYTKVLVALFPSFEPRFSSQKL